MLDPTQPFKNETGPLSWVMTKIKTPHSGAILYEKIHNITDHFRAKQGDKNRSFHATQVVSFVVFVVLSTNLCYLSLGTRSRIVSY